MEIQSISLGDALRKLAVNMQTDLQNSLLLMRGQDPELRTVEMRSFIARSRRKLTQFYAIVRWLSTAGVSQCFRGVADFNSQMATIDGEMARNLDEMYFVHASIYSMRSRPLEVTKAMDMLARKTYYNLPGAMFSCGRPEFPQALDPEEVVRDLCVFTNVKLNSSDRIGSNWPVNLSVTQGMLTIDYPGYFQLFLTLKTLSEHSDWTVLNCTLPCARTLCDSVTSKQIRAEVNQETEQLVAALRKTCATQQAICDDAAQVPAQAQDTPQQPRGALQEMLQQCRAAALAIGLKVLHQKLEVSLEAASYFKDTYHVRLVNSQQQQKELNSNKQYLSVKFWRSTFQEDFLFEAKVLQLPPDSPIGAGLQVEVHTALSYQDPTMVFPPSDSSRFFAIPGTSSRLPGEKYLRSTSRINSNSNDNINRNTYSSRSSASSCSEELGNGKGGDAIGDGECDARSLVRDVLALCADLKLTILVHRLAVTIGTLSGSFQSTYSVEKSHAAVILRSLAVDCLAASICIHVDARNGKYTTELQNFGDIQGLGKRELDLFIAEINNVDAERHVSNYLLKNGVNCGQSAENPFANIRIQTAPITTLEDVLRLFPLTLWAAEAQKHLPDAANLSTLAAVLLPACGLGKRGLVYNIKCWDEVDPQWLRDQSRADYQALFPASLADLSDKTLVTAALSAPATSTAKRNQAKKRGFSEVALANTVPGDFVSAASLAESQQPVEKARFVVLKHSKKAIAQYFLVSVGADAVVSLLSCICRITVTAYGAQLEHSHPAVLHHRTFAQCNVETTTAIAGGEGGGAPSATAVHFEAMLKEATEWGTTLVHRPMPCSECGFENPGNSIDVLSHPGGGVTTVLPEPPAGASTTSTVLVQVVSMADRAGDAGAFSKTCKRVASSVPGHSFSTCAAATAAKLSPFVSFPVWMLPSVGEAACFTCRDVAFASSAFKDAPTACHISVFATEVLQSIFTAWSFPAAGSVKLELLKRVKFAYLVLQILRGLVSAPSAAKASALASADSGDSMDVVDGSADASAKVVGAGSGASSLLPPVFRLIHFTVEPVATTASASGCTVSFTCAPDLPTCAGCLLVKISYTCSTMRGQGKSINVAEISSVELRDILPGRFERQFSAEELLENHMALLTTALTDYITSCQ